MSKVPHHEKKETMAVILSFFCIGLGQAYNGQTGKAVLFLTLYALSIGLTFFMVGFVTTPILWIWNVIDAYRSSRKTDQPDNAGPTPFITSIAGCGVNACRDS